MITGFGGGKQLRERFLISNFRCFVNVVSISVIKTSQLMLYREIIAVCSEILTKHINTLCGRNVELLNVKLAVHTVTTGLQRVKFLL
jgi:hypothetical protein